MSSSYLSEQMHELHAAAKQQQLCFVNEVGLDPGLDHLLAHSLMADYQSSAVFDRRHKHYFRSYCGGFPKLANDFRYKFSWSPAGVLTALLSPARWQRHATEQTTARPWLAVTDYQALLANGQRETFQAYPNRDSLPFKEEYGFHSNWRVEEFVRGTLRLAGWTDAWADIFRQLEAAQGEPGKEQIKALSDQLWQQYAYAEGESDRVVLCVELEVRDADSDAVLWHQSYSLDEAANERGSAMARLVSLTVSLAVEAVLDGSIKAGVSVAPSEQALVNDWLQQLQSMGENIHLNRH